MAENHPLDFLVDGAEPKVVAAYLVDPDTGEAYRASGGSGGASGDVAIIVDGDPVSALNPLPVSGTFSAEPPEGAATEDKQDAIITALGLLATQTTAAAILAKLSSDPATQTTLAAVLAKLSSDPATQTTLAALLTKQDDVISAIEGIPGGGGGGGGLVEIDISGTKAGSATTPINVAGTFSADPPEGAATEDKQDDMIAALGATTDAEATGDGSQIGLLKRLRTLLGGTLTVGLPSGASTASNQSTINTSIGTVNTSVGTVNTSIGTTNSSIGATNDTAANADTGTFSLNALVKRGLARWTTLLTLLPASLGSKTSANSFPVVVASDQGTIGVSVSGVSTAANQTTLNSAVGAAADSAASTDTGTFSLIALIKKVASNISTTNTNVGTTNTNLGTTTDAAATGNGSLIAVLKQVRTFLDAPIGGVTETAPSTDTASSGLNGRLQRIAQNITADVGATNESAASTDTSTSGLNGLTKRLLQRMTTLIGIFTGGTTGAPASVPGATSATTLKTSNTSRKMLVVYNDSDADLYVLAGTGTVSSSLFTFKLAPADTLTISGMDWTGAVTGIWTSATGNARVTEWT